MSINDLANFNINQDIAQGADFKKYKKTYENSSGNVHRLLDITSSQHLSSVNEAFTSDSSVNKKTELESGDDNDETKELFNSLISDYANEQNVYNSGAIQKRRKNVTTDDAFYQELMAEKLEGFTPFFDFKLKKKYEGFSSNRDTLEAKIETSNLNMTSMYYHYLVYFVISITLLAFTFNTIFNPNANVMNAIIVVGALLLVYFFTRNIA